MQLFYASNLFLVCGKCVALCVGEIPNVLSYSERISCYPGHQLWILITLFCDEFLPGLSFLPPDHVFWGGFLTSILVWGGVLSDR